MYLTALLVKTLFKVDPEGVPSTASAALAINSSIRHTSNPGMIFFIIAFPPEKENAFSLKLFYNLHELEFHQ
jgi:hypothetical protein